MAKNYDIECRFATPTYTWAGEAVEGYLPGDTVQAQVRLRPHQDVQCRGIHLELGYLETGRGTRHEERMLDEKVFDGALPAGREWTHEVRFELPEGGIPISYTGHHVNYTWFVRIRLDIPIWVDPREEFPFRVLPLLLEAPTQSTDWSEEGAWSS